MKLNDIQEKINNKEISIDGANYYLLILIAEGLEEIKSIMSDHLSIKKRDKIINKINNLINKTGVKNGK